MKYAPGQSGNPSGKKKGTLNKKTKLANLLEPYAEELVEKAVELARGGDVNALRLCIERLIPKAKPEAISLEGMLVKINDFNSLTLIGVKILEAVINGSISPSDGKILSSMTEIQRKLIEHGIMRERLDAIEDSLKIRK